MKIFLSALETKKDLPRFIVEKGVRMKYNLMFYYAIQKKSGEGAAEYIRDHSEEVMVDSGAHSFQKGIKVDWDGYTRRYAEFIRRFDRPNVVGFFEMDVDNVIGYAKVLELRSVLLAASDKIIPVWHCGRGVADFKEMCRRFQGKVVAITGFRNQDIRDEQYAMFLKEAHRWNCRLHCLGMTRKVILDKVPFDYADSSSWLQTFVYGKVLGDNRHLDRDFWRNDSQRVLYHNYLEGMAMQEHYFNRWRRYE